MIAEARVQELEARVAELERKLTTRERIDEEYKTLLLRKAREYGFAKVLGVELDRDGSRVLMCHSEKQARIDYYARSLCSLAEEMVRCLATEA